jgi:hypothetical protein
VTNIIVRPDLFARDRLVITEEPFLIVDGVLQNQDGVTSVRAEQVRGIRGAGGSRRNRGHRLRRATLLKSSSSASTRGGDLPPNL